MARRWGLYFVTIFFLCSCGLFNKNSFHSIKFDSSVPDEQKDLLISDMQFIESLQLSNVTQEDLNKINLREISPDSLTRFLLDRVKYIVGQDFDADSQKSVLANNYYYSPSVVSSVDSMFDRVVTVMTNTGSAVYLDGKKNNTLYSLKVADETMVVSTTRVGIIKIGEGLFSSSRTSGFSQDSIAKRLIRLGTLFHESRHSDGNGSNAGFPHSKCSSGDFAGYYACESNTNGPYNLESMLLKHFYRSCYNCSESELSAIQISASDAASRLQYGATVKDPTPEYIR